MIRGWAQAPGGEPGSQGRVPRARWQPSTSSPGKAQSPGPKARGEEAAEGGPESAEVAPHPTGTPSPLPGHAGPGQLPRGAWGAAAGRQEALAGSSPYPGPMELGTSAAKTLAVSACQHAIRSARVTADTWPAQWAPVTGR